MGNKQSNRKEESKALSKPEMNKWKKSFEEYRVFEKKKKIPTAFLGIPLLLWREIILPMVLAPKGSCDSCTFAMGRKNYFSLRLVCWQFLSMVGGDDELWKKVVSRALGRDSLRAWGDVFWDEEKKIIRKVVVHSVGSGFLETDFYNDVSNLVNSTLVARKMAINKWLEEKSKWELISLFAVYRPVLTVKVEQGIHLPEDYVSSNCSSHELDSHGNFPMTLHFINTYPGKLCRLYNGSAGKGSSFPEDDLLQEGRVMQLLDDKWNDEHDKKKLSTYSPLCYSAYSDSFIKICNKEKTVCKECNCFNGRSFPVYCQLENNVTKYGCSFLKFNHYDLKLEGLNNELLFAMNLIQNYHYVFWEKHCCKENSHQIVPSEMSIANNITDITYFFSESAEKEEIAISRFASNVIKLNVNPNNKKKISASKIPNKKTLYGYSFNKRREENKS